jgi:nucleoside transporter
MLRRFLDFFTLIGAVLLYLCAIRPQVLIVLSIHFWIHGTLYAYSCFGQFGFFPPDERSGKGIFPHSGLGDNRLDCFRPGYQLCFLWDEAGNLSKGMLKNTFLMASISSLILGLFSFTLPKTPPRANKNEKVKIADLIGLDALKLLKDKNYAVFFLSSILICIPLAFYYQNANPFLSEIGVTDPTGKMTIGQVSEVLFLLLLPFFFKRFGFKMTMLVGMLAWVVRYALFSIGDADGGLYLLIIGIALHGICYDFFFVSGQIYTDSKAGEKFQSSAQGLITLATYGLGMLIGFAVAGQVTDLYLNADGTHDWKSIWMIPSGIAILVVLIFLIFFKNETMNKKPETKPIES